MCFEKPCDIRKWLVCTNHCSAAKRHTPTYCTFRCERVHSVSGGHRLWACTRIHGNEQSRHVSDPRCKLQGCVSSARSLLWASWLRPGVEWLRPGVEWARGRGGSWPLHCSDTAQRVHEGDVAPLLPPISAHTHQRSCLNPEQNYSHGDTQSNSLNLWFISSMCCLHLFLFLKHRAAVRRITNVRQTHSCQNMWQLQAAVTSDYHVPTVPCLQHGLRPLAAHWRRAVKAVDVCTHPQCVGQQLVLSTPQWIGLLRGRMGGNYAETVAAPRGCSQLLISVCVGLHRPQVRIQFSSFSFTQPLLIPATWCPLYILHSICGLWLTPRGRILHLQPHCWENTQPPV